MRRIRVYIGKFELRWQEQEGLRGAKILPDAGIDGFCQSLRDAEPSNATGHIEANRTMNHSAGGYTLPGDENYERRVE